MIETSSDDGNTSIDTSEEYIPNSPSTSVKATTTSTTSKKSEATMMSALKGALVSLADGGASQMIKEAIQNLELKLKIKTSKSKRHENVKF